MGLFRYTWRSFAREFTLIALAIAFCVPAYVLLSLSLKTTTQAYTEPFKFPTSAELGNYASSWQQAGESGMGDAFITSATVTVLSVLGLIFFGSLCAYALARRPSKLSTTLYILFVVGIILPFQLAIIPIYVVMGKLGLTGSEWGLIIVYIALMMPFTVFLYTGFIRALPIDYEEAARVDGAGFFRTYIEVVFPLLLPVTGSVAILSGLVIWNDFFLPLIFLFGSDKQTLPLTLYTFVGEYTSQWNLIMAGVAISIAPILAFYLFAQRQLIRGFSGGIRG
jgi:raffinose/stachyose/melibiose transport system permease protein